VPDIDDYEESVMTTAGCGPGTVSFYWRVSSEEDYDYLEFYLDDELQDRISGISTSWQLKSYNVEGEGKHTFTWRYVKDGSDEDGNDRGYVDYLQWTGDAEPESSEWVLSPAFFRGVGALVSVAHEHPWEKLMPRRKQIIVVGVDLAGSVRRATGVCVLRRMTARAHVAHGDEEILDAIERAQPDLVPIDAPLSLPAGRKTIHDRAGEHLRECDRELQRRKIRFFPITLGPMRMLTERGLALKAKIEAKGYRVVECYPGAAQDVWGIPRQHGDRQGLVRGLEDLGVQGLSPEMTGDELDAVTAALVGHWFLAGQGEMLGGANGIVIPLSHAL